MTASISLLHPRVQTALAKHELRCDVMECDPNLADTAAFLEHYGYTADQTCNAIVVATKTDPVRYACFVILATQKLDVNKKACQILESKRCSFASAEQTLALTDMMIGGVTPVGVDVPIYIDSSVMSNKMVVLGGGNRSTKLLIDPAQLTKLPHVAVVDALGLPR